MGKTGLAMKILSFLVFCLYAVGAIYAQQPLSRDEALKQLYHNYNGTTQTAQWACASGQNVTWGAWPCGKDDQTVAVSELLMAEVKEGDVAKVYFVASAVPDHTWGEYDCHACAPAIGVVVFAWNVDHWALQSANAGAAFYGEWGEAPDVYLVTIGPHRYGLMLSGSNEGQGYSASYKVLLVPLAKTVSRAWSIVDEQDDFGAYDPTDNFGPKTKYRSSAAIKFVAGDEIANGPRDYYDIEVISRGVDSPGTSGRLKRENWTETFRFRGGRFELLRHTDFVEVKKAAAKKRQAKKARG